MKKIKIEVRKARLKDISGIIELCNEVFGEKTDIEKAKKDFIESLNDKNHVYLVGLKDGVIVAHLKITIIPTMYGKMGTYAIINHVCVNPSLRRHHMATRLLDEAAKICKKHNCSSIKLWSDNYREAAHACYKKYGFNKVDTTFFSIKI